MVGGLVSGTREYGGWLKCRGSSGSFRRPSREDSLPASAFRRNPRRRAVRQPAPCGGKPTSLGRDVGERGREAEEGGTWSPGRLNGRQLGTKRGDWPSREVAGPWVCNRRPAKRRRQPVSAQEGGQGVSDEMARCGKGHPVFHVKHGVTLRSLGSEATGRGKGSRHFGGREGKSPSETQFVRRKECEMCCFT